MEKHEKFDEHEGKYTRNGETCDASVAYHNKMSKKDPQFYIIEKKGANWDQGLKPSFSIGWKSKEDYFVLGLPTELRDLQELQNFLNKLIKEKKN